MASLSCWKDFGVAWDRMRGVGYRMTTRGRSKTTTTWLVFGDEGVEEGLEGL